MACSKADSCGESSTDESRSPTRRSSTMDIAPDLMRDTPIMASERERIEMTVRCRDCDGIPKVERAGEILDEGGGLVQIMHNGIRVVAGGYYGSFMTEVIQRLQGHHEPQEELVFHEILKRVPRF